MNIPFLHAIEIPSIARFLKDHTTNHKKTEGVVNFSKECSVVLLMKLPLKVDDPCSFSILISIGSLVVDDSLCDLRASISLMPLSM